MYITDEQNSGVKCSELVLMITFIDEHDKIHRAKFFNMVPNFYCHLSTHIALGLATLTILNENIDLRINGLDKDNLITLRNMIDKSIESMS